MDGSRVLERTAEYNTTTTPPVPVQGRPGPSSMRLSAHHCTVSTTNQPTSRQAQTHGYVFPTTHLPVPSLQPYLPHSFLRAKHLPTWYRPVLTPSLPRHGTRTLLVSVAPPRVGSLAGWLGRRGVVLGRECAREGRGEWMVLGSCGGRWPIVGSRGAEGGQRDVRVFAVSGVWGVGLSGWVSGSVG
jgi:hypothetical protein